ncbi:MAG: F0F1 ATP synthase subunit B [Phycisphaerae bacterium]
MLNRSAHSWLAAAALAAISLVPISRAADPHASDPRPAAEHAAAPAHDGGAEHEPANLFAGDIGNAVFTLIIFFVLIGVLGKYAWKPLLSVLEQREQAIRGSLEQARRERLDAEKLLAQYRQQIDRAREEATGIVDEGKRDAEAVRRRIHDEARQEADQMVARAKREIELATSTAVKELYDQTTELTVQLAGTVARKSLTPDDHRALIKESLERIQASRN